MPGGDWQPRQVLLFSGHMVDAPDREKPRFPADKQHRRPTDRRGARCARRRSKGSSIVPGGRRGRPVVSRGLPAAWCAMSGPPPLFRARVRHKVDPAVRCPVPGGATATSPRANDWSVRNRASTRSNGWPLFGSCRSNSVRCRPVPIRSNAATCGCSTQHSHGGVAKARFVCLWNGAERRWTRRPRTHVQRSRGAYRPGYLDRYAQRVSPTDGLSWVNGYERPLPTDDVLRPCSKRSRHNLLRTHPPAVKTAKDG